jgi:hypothetical protein
MWRRVVRWVETYVSEENIASIFSLLAGSCWNYFFDPEDGGDMFLRNVGLQLNGLHGVTSQKMILFIDEICSAFELKSEAEV